MTPQRLIEYALAITLTAPVVAASIGFSVQVFTWMAP